MASCSHRSSKHNCPVCRPSLICKHGITKRSCWFCDSIGWAKYTIAQHKQMSKEGKYTRPQIDATSLVSLRKKSKSCLFCMKKLNWFWTKRGEAPNLHHNHRTGEVFGYVHGSCNSSEARIRKQANFCGVKAYLKNMFPEVFKQED